MKKLFLAFLIVIVIVAGTIAGYNSYYHIVYPLKYEEEVTVYAEKYRLPPSLVMSVIKTESSFRESAVSAAGAVGLMQLMPATAEEIAEDLGMEFSETLLKNPNINIEIGCYQLRYLLDKYNVTETAVAAYNAGEGNVSKWLLDTKYSSDGLRLDNIPFKETSNYVERVLTAKKAYVGYYRLGE